MRKLFKSKIFIFGLILAVLGFGVMIYAFVSPSPTPISNLMGAIVTPVEKAVNWVGDGVGGFFDYFKGYDRFIYILIFFKKKIFIRAITDNLCFRCTLRL
jgi:cell shape-determining protein MreC